MLHMNLFSPVTSWATITFHNAKKGREPLASRYMEELMGRGRPVRRPCCRVGAIRVFSKPLNSALLRAVFESSDNPGQRQRI